jgi:hypothetical protein
MGGDSLPSAKAACGNTSNSASGEARRFRPYNPYVKPALQTRCGFEATLAVDVRYAVSGVRRK